MRKAISVILAIALWALPQAALAATGMESLSTHERILGWVYAYRAAPKPDQLPGAVHAMRDLNLFKEQEGEGASLLIGFIAGVLAKNPRKADVLVTKMFPMPAKEQGVIIKAIAYSGLPDWKGMLTRFAKRMPERQAYIDDLLAGRAKPLMEIPLNDGTHVLYTLWGYYLATGSYEPILRIMTGLRWAKPKSDGFSFGRLASTVGFNDGRDINKITVGSTCKWILALQAERDRDLLKLYRDQAARQPKRIARPLNDVVAAAEVFQSDRIRKEELAVVQAEAQRQARLGNSMSPAAYAGSVGISAACIIAGTLGHPEIAIPCVITGVVYSGAAALWMNSR